MHISSQMRINDKVETATGDLFLVKQYGLNSATKTRLPLSLTTIINRRARNAIEGMDRQVEKKVPISIAMKKCPRFVGVVDLDAHNLSEAVVPVDRKRAQ